MNREIKFRAWDINKKVFIPNDAYAVITSYFNAFGVMLKDWEDYREGEYFYKEHQVLMQFTGLKDKNGVDIYEGDIVRVGYIVKVVRFKIGKSFCGYNIGTGYKKNPIIEVIGNIYQNPELLKY